MTGSTLLDNISIVLVDTRTPANIGATARCMMNTGLSRLVLVHPLRGIDNESRRLAAGADCILDSAEVHARLGDAIAGHGLVVGVSRHKGRRRKNILSPRLMTERVLPVLSQNRTAIVFGNEVNGLDNDALSLCHELVAIPLAEAFPSLNLSHAVMVIAYELYSACTEAGTPPSSTELAHTEDLEFFYAHLEETLRAIEFVDQQQTGRMMFSLRQIFNRSRLDHRDVSIFRGILTAIDRVRGNIA